ncbi:hypothetical protein SCLCIDRAFT_738609 [Scleroderma citrinum Foug A]|uniref:Uncharacterized protein n=1 Tax=Scleroderma citrinum Foug A TaxID=1036808 RepID=A0A0C2ZQ85_9AGAM|nr:hypothetical protein SCLCIDRAFT_738609 [Scleroderma citrinum Foug A]
MLFHKRDLETLMWTRHDVYHRRWEQFTRTRLEIMQYKGPLYSNIYRHVASVVLVRRWPLSTPMHFRELWLPFSLV